MTTNYDKIAQEYKESKTLPWRKHLEAYTLLKVLKNLQGLNVLDLACGEGFYTRMLKLSGASKAVGIDLSKKMIELARKTETENPLGITYYVGNAADTDLHETFDIVAAAYLLNYAQSPKELQAFTDAIYRHLKPGGRFVTINNNPMCRNRNISMKKYGFERKQESDLEGSPVVYDLYANADHFITVTNYHLTQDTHLSCFAKSGFKDVTFHSMEVSPDGIKEFGADFWQDILECQPVIGISCTKP